MMPPHTKLSKPMNNDDLKDFLLDCHIATGNLENLAQYV